MRRILLLTSAIVLVDTLFFAALTPLLPHYAHTLGLGKAGAGVLSGAYPAGALVGGIPSGIVAARLGVKPTVLIGLTFVAITTAIFGFATEAWQLDLARFAQGIASSFSWTGALTWLIAATPIERRGAMIGSAFASAVGGALFGPVVGGVASYAGTSWTFGTIAVCSMGLAVWALLTHAEKPESAQPLSAFVHAMRDPHILLGGWFILLPALIFGAISVIAPLRLSELGFGAAAIGAIWLIAAAIEAVNNILLGRFADRRGTLLPLRLALAGSFGTIIFLALPGNPYVLGVLLILAAVASGAFYTPGMALLTNAAEARGLEYGYAFALINVMWAPGQVLGAVAGGSLAQATSDRVPYALIALVCAATFFGLHGRRDARHQART